MNAEVTDILDSVVFPNDTIYYERVGDSKDQLVLYSVKYGSMKFGNKISHYTPEKLRYYLEFSQGNHFLITRSCGSECWISILVDVISGQKIIETENLVHYDLKERILITRKNRTLSLFKIVEKGVKLIENRTVNADVQCVNFNDCIVEKKVNKNSIQFKLEAVAPSGDIYIENVEFTF